MGCDIHAYIEYADTRGGPAGHYDCVCSLHINRDYMLFGLLAGVRCKLPESYKPKGIPDNLSWTVKDEYTLYVTDMDDMKPERGYVDSKWAMQAIEKGYAKWYDEKHTRIVNTDWHTPSWLTTAEVKQVIASYTEYAINDPYAMGNNVDILAVYGMMKALFGIGLEPRFVFWFDN